MIDEGRARELLGNAGRDVSVGAAPIEALVRRGRRARWQRRAAPALAVAVVGAVVVVGGRGLGSLDADPAPADPADSDPGLVLNTSEWEPGDDATEALGGGMLAVSDDGCVHVASHGSAGDIVWPAGYTATFEPDGRVVVRRPDGQIVAAQGSRVEAGGGEAGPGTEFACRAPDSRGAFAIQDVMEPLERVDVLDHVGQTQWQAEDLLDDAGFDVRVIHDPEAIGPGVAPGTVVDQQPAGGAAVLPFDDVTLRVAAPDPEANEGDRAIAEAMLSFAASADPSTVDFADEVLLALSEGEQRTVSRDDAVAGGEVWVFREQSRAPVSILEALRSIRDDYSLWVGPHNRCGGGPPIEPPDQLGDLRQLSIEPTDTQSCLEWFAVDLYVEDGGEVAGVVLDRWDP